MMEEFDRHLSLTDENGMPFTIEVIDIIDENDFNKEFIVYTVEGDENTMYASILNEKEDSYSLDTIYDNNELLFINTYLDTLLNEA